MNLNVKKIPVSSGSHGFTLLEILVALVISGLLIIILTRIYSNTVKNYSLQDEIVDMNQNARFVIKEISNILSEAGADCAIINRPTPIKDTIIKLSGGGPVYNEFTIKVNPRSGLYSIPYDTTLNTMTTCSLMVNDASTFRYADKLARIPGVGSTDSTIKVYNLIGVNTESNKICFNGGTSTSETFSAGDAIYSFVNRRYFLNGTDLCLNDTINVLAENISVFKIIFYNSSGDSVLTSSPPWKSMRSARLDVEATTSRRISDHKLMRVKLSYEFRFRNRVGEEL